MNTGLKDKIVLLSNGCGCGAAAMAKAYREEGARVCAICKSEPAGAFDAVYTDVTTEEEAEALCAAITEQFGLPDILVLNRFEIGTRHYDACTRAELMATIDEYVTNAFILCRAFGTRMREACRGNILVMTSLHDERPSGSDVPHSIAMGMLKNMAGELSQNLGHEGVRVNQLCVGPIGDWADAADKQDSTFLEAWKYKIAGPLYTWEDVAQSVLYATSAMSPGLNGACIRIDAGLSHHYLDYQANYRAFKAGEKELEVRK